MCKHYITQYVEEGKRVVEAWSQINLFGKSFCFHKRKLTVEDLPAGKEEQKEGI